MKKIILCGYMASGKTTVARLLSAASGIDHLDLDTFIETQQGKTIPEIFTQNGEIKFRKMEHEAFKEILKSDEGFVLSLGGGTPCYANNHLLLQRDDVISVYLKASIPHIIQRLENETIHRPLLGNLHGDALQEFIGQHLFERSYYYRQAKHTVNTDGKEPEAIVNEIMSLF